MTTTRKTPRKRKPIKRTFLNDKEIARLRKQRAKGAKLRVLAKRWGLSESGVSRIISQTRRNVAA